MPANGPGAAGSAGRRDGIDLAHHPQDAGQFAALVAPIRRQQQPAFGRYLRGWGGHGSSLTCAVVADGKSYPTTVLRGLRGIVNHR